MMYKPLPTQKKPVKERYYIKDKGGKYLAMDRQGFNIWTLYKWKAVQFNDVESDMILSYQLTMYTDRTPLTKEKVK